MSDDPVQQSYERGYVWMVAENARLQRRVGELEVEGEEHREESATRDADYVLLLQRVLDFVSRIDVQAVDPEAEAIAQQIRWRLPAL